MVFTLRRTRRGENQTRTKQFKGLNDEEDLAIVESLYVAADPPEHTLQRYSLQRYSRQF